MRHKFELSNFEAEVQRFLARMETMVDQKDIKDEMNRLSCWLYTGDCDILFIAMDPVTGDSALHRAAAAGNVDALTVFMDSFPPNPSQQPEQERRIWVLLTYQNRAGDTMLHAAARAGKLESVKGVYHMIFGYEIVNDPELDSPNSDYPPVEYWDWADTTKYDQEFSRAPLDFVCTKNQAGRDAAGEARVAGHEDVAVWLDEVAAKLDYEHMRDDEEYMKALRRTVLEWKRYFEDEEEKEEASVELVIR